MGQQSHHILLDAWWSLLHRLRYRPSGPPQERTPQPRPLQVSQHASVDDWILCRGYFSAVTLVTSDRFADDHFHFLLLLIAGMTVRSLPCTIQARPLTLADSTIVRSSTLTFKQYIVY
jgi:hypothetical protein